MARPPNSSSRAQRNLNEKIRRKQMKELIGKLASLIPPQPSKLSIAGTLDRATSYIMHLQKNRESLKKRISLLRGDQECNNLTATVRSPRMLPTMNITALDSILEVYLICGLMNRRNFMLHEIIRVLQDEGGEIIDATQLNAGDRIIYIIKCKAIVTRIGMDTSRIKERLKDLVL